MTLGSWTIGASQMFRVDNPWWIGAVRPIGTPFNTANWTTAAEATVTNPSSDLTDFTLLIDLSNMPAAWQAAVQESGGDIRVTKGDDTELAFDLINWDYNSGSPTGYIRAKWSGTLASTGTQKVKVWSGYTLGTAYEYWPDETYGRFNAYDSYFVGYWPDGAGADRTSTGAGGAPMNSLTVGGADDPNGEPATDFDGSNDYSQIPDATYSSTISDLMLVSFVNYDSWGSTGQNNEWNCSLDTHQGDGTDKHQWSFEANADSGNDLMLKTNAGSTSVTIKAGMNTETGAWHMVGGRRVGSTITTIYDGADNNTASFSGDVDLSDGFRLGGRGASQVQFDGKQSHAQLHVGSGRSSAWTDQEYQQVINQDTFWSTWTTAGGEESSSTPIVRGVYLGRWGYSV